MRALLQITSPSGPRGRLSVLVLHRVVPAADAIYPEAMHIARFDALCRWVRSMFEVLPLDQAVPRLATGTLPARALAITFDDGYADNASIALPILQRHGLPATFFIATGFLDGGAMWNDSVVEAVRHCAAAALDLREELQDASATFPLATAPLRRAAIEAILAEIKYLPPAARDERVRLIARRCGMRCAGGLMMTPAQVIGLRRAGMQIGAHTVSHPILATLDQAAARREIAESKSTLERLLDERVGLFAYPNGKPGRDYTADTVALTRELGFDAAVSTARGAAHRGTDRFQLPRFTPWDRSPLRFGARMAGNLWASRARGPA